ncbi:unnamed protein product [Vitrella brassicaformis CCMP3155]|uniref:Uncharacterized protein n=1 Tax=Vitrella brassicaformis (strain CCMP3155) TaxID=1169540 RepID=A0A0G4GBA5_VITBC|nr:unnamed protein product [Vitrella brassicaformis CCMP3155]|eukprot:CEM25951.1 unnamed protein product [Vitrella brassicaformis CCMP3155]
MLRRALLGDDDLVERTGAWNVFGFRGGEGTVSAVARLLGSDRCFAGREHVTREGNTERNSLKVDESSPFFLKISPMRSHHAHIFEAVFAYRSISTMPAIAAAAAAPAPAPAPVPAAADAALADGADEDDPQGVGEVQVFYAGQLGLVNDPDEMNNLDDCL